MAILVATVFIGVVSLATWLIFVALPATEFILDALLTAALIFVILDATEFTLAIFDPTLLTLVALALAVCIALILLETFDIAVALLATVLTSVAFGINL